MDYLNKLRLNVILTYCQPSDSKLDTQASCTGPAMSILLLVNSFTIILGQTRVDIY